MTTDHKIFVAISVATLVVAGGIVIRSIATAPSSPARPTVGIASDDVAPDGVAPDEVASDGAGPVRTTGGGRARDADEADAAALVPLATIGGPTEFPAARPATRRSARTNPAGMPAAVPAAVPSATIPLATLPAATVDDGPTPAAADGPQRGPTP